MSRSLLFILFTLAARVCSAQVVDTLVVEKDSFKYDRKNYRYAYTLIIRDKKHESHEGFVYRLGTESITICNINPKLIDSTNRDSLVFYKIKYTHILDIEKPRKSKAAAFIVPLVPAVAISAALINNPDTSRKRAWHNALSVGAGVIVYGITTGIGLIIASIPRIYEVNFNKEDYDYVLRRLQIETAYKVYRD